MGRIILVTGGSRSGKSLYAQQLAESIHPKRLYVATCPIIDPELSERVRRHKEQRAGRNWDTIEEQTGLRQAVERAGPDGVILIDCLTLWVNNLMYHARQKGHEVSEEDVAQLCSELCACCRASAADVIMVGNEVGMGVIPDNHDARHFRDLSGRCNQCIADEADEVAFMVSGLPLFLKKALA